MGCCIVAAHQRTGYTNLSWKIPISGHHSQYPLIPSAPLKKQPPLCLVSCNFATLHPATALRLLRTQCPVALLQLL